MDLFSRSHPYYFNSSSQSDLLYAHQSVPPFIVGDLVSPFIANLQFVQDKLSLPWSHMLQLITSKLSGEPLWWFHDCYQSFVDLESFGRDLQSYFGPSDNDLLSALNEMVLQPYEDVRTYHP